MCFVGDLYLTGDLARCNADGYFWNALGKLGFDYDWLLPHPLCEALGRDADSRRQAYRRLFRAPERAPRRAALRGALTQGATEEKQVTPFVSTGIVKMLPTG